MTASSFSICIALATPLILALPSILTNLQFSTNTSLQPKKSKAHKNPSSDVFSFMFWNVTFLNMILLQFLNINPFVVLSLKSKIIFSIVMLEQFSKL